MKLVPTPSWQEYFEYTPGILRAYVKPKHLDALTFTLQPVIEVKMPRGDEFTPKFHPFLLLQHMTVDIQNDGSRPTRMVFFGVVCDLHVFPISSPALKLPASFPCGQASLPDAHGLQVHLGRSEGVERGAEDSHLQVPPSME